MWDNMPDPMLLQIFGFLEKFSDLLSSSRVCEQWHRVSMDESLWRRLFIEDFRPKFYPSTLNFTWFEEYKRTKYEAPVESAESLSNCHTDEVLYVSFSHDGSLFASCSKDGFVKVWISEYPCKLKCERNLKDQFGWIYTQNAQFCDSDDLLLVSGVRTNFSLPDPASGDIAIFRLEANDLCFCCRIPVRPYDFFGCWYDSTWFLSGDYEYISDVTSSTTISLCKSSQEAESEKKRITARLYKFLNLNASSVRMATVGMYVSDWLRKTVALINVATSDAKGQGKENLLRELSEMGECSRNSSDKLLIFTCGSKTYTPHQIGFKIILGSIVEKKLDEEVMSDKRLELVKNRLKEMRENNQSLDNLLEQPANLTPMQQLFQNIGHQVEDHDEDNGEPNAVALDQLNENILRNFFDFPDHIVDFNGHITGLRLDADHRNLYVNVRLWPTEVGRFSMRNLLRKYAKNLYDLSLFIKIQGGMKNGSPKDLRLFGSEDKNAYLWDRRFGYLIKKFEHEAVVNCVAFRPPSKKVEEFPSTNDDYLGDQMMVTASDDKTLRVWRSKKALDYFQSRKSL